MKTCFAAATFMLLASSLIAHAQPGVTFKGAGPFDTHEKLVEAIRALGDKELADAMNDTKLGVDHLTAAEFDKAETHLKRTLPVFQKRFPDSAIIGAINILLAGSALGRGDLDLAEKYTTIHLKTARNIPIGVEISDEDILLSYGIGVSMMATILEQRGDYAGAERYQREVLAMWEKLFTKDKHPKGHFTLVATRTALARIVAMRGDYEAAEKLANEAIEMLEKLSDGTQRPILDPVALSSALNAQAAILLIRGTPMDIMKAEQLQKKALELLQQAFPKGHPFLAIAIHNQATTDFNRGDLPMMTQRLADSRGMLTRFYPDGHPDLCQVIRDQGYVSAALGQFLEAEKLTAEALAMAEALFPATRLPNGHPILAHCLTQSGYLVLRTPNGAESAARFFREAARIMALHTTGQAELLSEVDTLNLLRIQFPNTLDGLLSATASGPFDPRDYQYVWASKAAVFRALERRHRTLLASTDAEAKALAEQLESSRSELAAKLFAPGRRGEPTPELAALSAKKEDLERRLNARLRLAAPLGGAAPHPFDLASKLPASAVYVDFIRYNRITPGPGVPGLTDRPENPHYAAFVLASGQRAKRVELGSAKNLDTAVEAWRAAIAALPETADERGAARDVANLLWVKVAEQFPAGTQTIYLAPDGPLTRVPFAALPGKGANTILLEEVTVAAVPSGPFLLDRLMPRGPLPASEGKSQMLIVGGVNYGPLPPGRKAPDALPGTEQEAKLIETLARDTGRANPVRLTDIGATTTAVLGELPKSRYAHIATHGFFAGRKAHSEYGLDPLAFAVGPRDLRTAGARNPLVLSGLILAGYNRTDPGAPIDHGLLTAEAIAGRQLAGMELAVLSACETGLGEEIGSEGAYSLQRAFHLTGCRTVVASLWQVGDTTTPDLMNRFYRHLWNGEADMTPAKALRAAQLELYRDWRATGERRPRMPIVSVTPLPRPPPPSGGPVRDHNANTYSWAGFVTSGAP